MASLLTRTSQTICIWQRRSWNGKDLAELHWVPGRSGCLAEEHGVKTLFQCKGYGEIQEKMLGHLFPWGYSSRASERGTFRRKKKIFIITPADISFLWTFSSCRHLNSTTLLRMSHKLGDLPAWKLFLRLSFLQLNFFSLLCVLLPLALMQEWALKQCILVG